MRHQYSEHLRTSHSSHLISLLLRECLAWTRRWLPPRSGAVPSSNVIDLPSCRLVDRFHLARHRRGVVFTPSCSPRSHALDRCHVATAAPFELNRLMEPDAMSTRVPIGYSWVIQSCGIIIHVRACGVMVPFITDQVFNRHGGSSMRDAHSPRAGLPTVPRRHWVYCAGHRSEPRRISSIVSAIDRRLEE
jgi:hypothetical protein